jgi:hypothetical protein
LYAKYKTPKSLARIIPEFQQSNGKLFDYGQISWNPPVRS